MPPIIMLTVKRVSPRMHNKSEDADWLLSVGFSGDHAVCCARAGGGHAKRYGGMGVGA